MSTKKPTTPVFAKIQGTLLDLSSCVSFEISEGGTGKLALVAETRLQRHHFYFEDRGEADRALKSICLRLNESGHRTPPLS
jgi:hypothetical protein